MDSIGTKTFKLSLISIILCIGLIIVALIAQNNGLLIQAFILIFTSNLVMVICLFGLRYYIKKLHKKDNI